MSSAPVSGGPRLGKLKGLRKDEDDAPQASRGKSQKDGVKVLPLLLMLVMFGPIILTGVVWIFDKVATSGWGVKVGLSQDPRTRLTNFYKKHNPTKMREVDKLLRKYEGRYNELFRKLEDKYVRVDPQKKKAQEEEEEYLREQARYEQEARDAQEKF